MTALRPFLAIGNRYGLPWLDSFTTPGNDPVTLVYVAYDFDKTTKTNTGFNFYLLNHVVTVDTHHKDIGTAQHQSVTGMATSSRGSELGNATRNGLPMIHAGLSAAIRTSNIREC
jgi:hypothetical protein